MSTQPHWHEPEAGFVTEAHALAPPKSGAIDYEDRYEKWLVAFLAAKLADDRAHSVACHRWASYYADLVGKPLPFLGHV